MWPKAQGKTPSEGSSCPQEQEVAIHFIVCMEVAKVWACLPLCLHEVVEEETALICMNNLKLNQTSERRIILDGTPANTTCPKTLNLRHVGVYF